MHTELDETGKTSFFKRRIFIKRLLLNVGWLIIMVLAYFVYALSFRRSTPDYLFPGYKALMVFYIPFLFFQGILHWFTLEHFYPEKRIGNIVWVVVMPVLILIGYGLVVLVTIAIALQRGFQILH